MKKKDIPDFSKRNHTSVIPNFFGLNKDLEIWQLGWDIDHKIEAKSSVSKKIFNYFVIEMCMNIIFYYCEDRKNLRKNGRMRVKFDKWLVLIPFLCYLTILLTSAEGAVYGWY